MSGIANDTRREVSLAIMGSGGAGVVTTGELLFNAAARSGLYGLMTKSYGPQIRGGESICFLRLGNRPFAKQADRIDLMVAFDWRNVERFQEELSFRPDAWVLYEKAEGNLPAAVAKTKNTFPIGWRELARTGEAGRGRPNILSLGVLGYALGMKEGAILEALKDYFRDRGKPALEENIQSFQAGWRWAKNEWKQTPCPLSAASDGESEDSSRWVLTGNQGIVVGSLIAGCDFYAGYPITPATTIMEDLSRYLPQRGGVMIQAEDELAAVNMAIGASFGGKKAMTATSGPGFSLMAEGLGLALMAEIPLVVIDVQRSGPSTGIPTKTEQSDLWAALASSHGDNPRIVLAPSSARACIELSVKAFAIAEVYQVPVVLLSDQFLASRTEIVDPLPLDTGGVPERQHDEASEAPSRGGGPTGDTVASLAIAEGLEHDAHGWPDASPTRHHRQSEQRLRKLDPLAREAGWIEICGEAAAAVGFIGWGSTGGVVREAVQVAQSEGRSVKGIIPHLLFPPQVDLLNRIFAGMNVL